MISLKGVILILYIVSLIYRCNATPAIPLQPPDQLLQATNSSNAKIVTNDRPHFSIRVTPQQDTDIGAAAMFFLSVEALFYHRIAGFKGCTTSTIFHLERYPNVDIDLISKHLGRHMSNEVTLLCHTRCTKRCGQTSILQGNFLWLRLGLCRGSKSTHPESGLRSSIKSIAC